MPGYPGPPGPTWAHRGSTEPDNGPAITGFVLAMVSIGLAIFTVGLSSIVSVLCAAFGIYYSRMGKRKADVGDTAKHRGLAQAGLICSIVGLVLAIIATLAWAVFFVLLITNEGFRNDLDDGGLPVDGRATTLRIAAVAARAAAQLVT